MYDLNKPPRLAPLTDAEWTEEQRELLEKGSRLNIFRTLARHPKLLKRWLVFGGHVLRKNTLPERERELLILRTGYRCKSAYEFHQHTSIGLQAGLTQAEIDRLKDDSATWTGLDAALVKAADELVMEHRLSDASWQALGAEYDEKQVLDVIFTVGQYTLVSMALNSAGVQIEGTESNK